MYVSGSHDYYYYFSRYRCDVISEMLFDNYITSLCGSTACDSHTKLCVVFFLTHLFFLALACLKSQWTFMEKTLSSLLGGSEWCEEVKTFKRAHTQHWWNRWWSCKFNEKKKPKDNALCDSDKDSIFFCFLLEWQKHFIYWHRLRRRSLNRDAEHKFLIWGLF